MPHSFEKCALLTFVGIENFVLYSKLKVSLSEIINVHDSPKIEHLPFSDMRKGEGQMKVKNLRNRKQNVQMNLLNLEQRDWQPNLSIKDKKLQMN